MSLNRIDRAHELASEHICWMKLNADNPHEAYCLLHGADSPGPVVMRPTMLRIGWDDLHDALMTAWLAIH